MVFKILGIPLLWTIEVSAVFVGELSSKLSIPAFDHLRNEWVNISHRLDDVYCVYILAVKLVHT